MRDRVQIFVDLVDDFKAPWKIIDTLNKLLQKGTSNESIMHRDLTSHILALVIDALGYEKCSKQATEFLEFLINNKSIDSNKLAPLSVNAYTFALMTLCKTNELAK